MKKKKLISPYAFPGIKRTSLPLNFNHRQLALNPKEVLEIVSKETYVTVEDILSQSRKGEVIVARHIFCGILKRTYNYSFTFIGEILHRDHTTIMSAVKNFSNRKEREDDFKDKTNRILEHINLKS
jgi:chromosomal replication initiator protein